MHHGHECTCDNWNCRCIKLCLVHDMAECIVGDLTPADDVPKEEKHEREKVRVGDA